MDLGLRGKTAIVTGAGQNIGREIAFTLAREGARVVVNDFFEERAIETAQEISEAEDVKAAGGEAIGLKADVTNNDEVNAMVKKVVDHFGRIDILVNNAGIAPDLVGMGYAIFLETNKPDWDKMIHTNLYGNLNCCRAVLPYMVKQRYGKIVSIISDAGRVGENRQVAYSGAKAGIVGVSKALAKEVGRFCINVNCVSPGATPAGNRVPREEVLRLYPIGQGLGRVGLPSDVANAVAFLASDRAAFVTGQVLSVSGGYSMVD